MDEKTATRARILDAAMNRIKHYGYGKTTMAEIAADAARKALAAAGKTGSQVDAVYCAAANMQRAYPAMAIEVQQALGIDLNGNPGSPLFNLAGLPNGLAHANNTGTAIKKREETHKMAEASKVTAPPASKAALERPRSAIITLDARRS